MRHPRLFFDISVVLNSPRQGCLSGETLDLVVSTCFLYLVAAGFFARLVWYLEKVTGTK